MSSSLARPTGNVTGVYLRRPELVEKQVELLAQTFPGRTRLGVLWDMHSPDIQPAERATASLNLQLRPLKLEIRHMISLRPFARWHREARKCCSCFPVPISTGTGRTSPDWRCSTVPPMLSTKYVEAGGLMSYGPTLTGMFRRLAYYVDRISKGAKP